MTPIIETPRLPPPLREAESLVKRSVRLEGHATSIALEPSFWKALEKIAKQHKVNLSELIAAVDLQRAGQPLTSALRVYALTYYKE